MYALTDFSNQWIPVGKCSMLLRKIEPVCELPQHGLEKSAVLLAHSLKTYVLPLKGQCLCNITVWKYGRNVL